MVRLLASKMFFYVMNGATDNSNSAAKVRAVDYQMRAKELRMLALRWRRAPSSVLGASAHRST